MKDEYPSMKSLISLFTVLIKTVWYDLEYRTTTLIFDHKETIVRLIRIKDNEVTFKRTVPVVTEHITNSDHHLRV